MNVLYIAGPSRSGSTLLGRILGELPGFFHGGELIDVWDRSILRNGACSCGQPFDRCDLWTRVMREAFGEDLPDVREMIRLRDWAARSRNVPAFLLFRSGFSLEAKLRHYLGNVGRLYEAIGRVTNSRVVVDASKNVGYAFLLNRIEGLDVFHVHLVRDARATAFSWRRGKAGLWEDRPVRVSLTWMSRNLSGELMGRRHRNRYLRIRYEDFVSDAQGTLRRIVDLVGEPHAPLPFLGPDEVELSAGHSMYGNPDRFDSGTLRLKADDRWTRAMTAFDRWTVLALTWPLLLRYRYPLFCMSREPRR